MNRNALQTLYEHRFENSSLHRRDQIWKVLCSHFFQKYVNQQEILLELACGYGEFIRNINAPKKIAFDLNPKSKQFLNAAVDFYNCSVFDLTKYFKNEIDIIFTSNFLEHLQNKNELEKLLAQIHIALNENGRIIILGPNLRYLNGKYWDFYDHHLGLTHLSLKEALEIQGFKVETCIDKFLPYTTKGSLPTHPFFVRWYLRFPLIWKLVGKQFLIIAKKHDL